MNSIFETTRHCGVVVTVAISLAAGGAMTPLRAADDLPVIGDIPMPQVYVPDVHVDVRVGEDIRPPPPRMRPPVIYSRDSYAVIPPARYEPAMMDGPAVAPIDVARMLRSTGYSLLGQINRRGWVYTVAVLNPRGDDGRAIIDARTGAIIRFIPAYAVTPRLDDRLGEIYGPPGPPPARELAAAPRPPKPRLASRDTTQAAAPALAVARRVSANAQAQVSPSKPADAHAEMKPVLVPQQQASPPETRLWPTQALPDVQTFE